MRAYLHTNWLSICQMAALMVVNHERVVVSTLSPNEMPKRAASSRPRHESFAKRMG